MRKKLARHMVVLAVLKDQSGPIPSARVHELLAVSGLTIGQRTVRLYLKELQEAGLTEAPSRRGHCITAAGLAALQSNQIAAMPNYLSAEIDQMIYRMTFDLALRSGSVVVNTSLVDPQHLNSFRDKIGKVFARGLGMGRLMSLVPPGGRVGQTSVPPDKVGFCTVCSITINGILLKHGILMHSRFGGLLRLVDGRASHFVEMIHYDGTSIDPLEAFIRSGMTDYHGAIRDGNGLIGASFREVPAESRPRLHQLSERMAAAGLGAVMEIGLPGQPLLGVPVPHGRIGVIVVGGLNPIAILEEREHRVLSHALSGLLDYDELFHFEAFPERLQPYL